MVDAVYWLRQKAGCIEDMDILDISWVLVCLIILNLLTNLFMDVKGCGKR